MTNQHFDLDVIIIGAGPAGISAAIWAKKLGLSLLLLEKNRQIGGQLHQIHNRIVDYPGIMVANGKELAERFLDHLKALNINTRVNCEVLSIKQAGNKVIVKTSQGDYITRYIVLATGSQPKRLNIPGEMEMIHRGEEYSTHRDLERLRGKRILIVGGGDRALESVCNLAEIADSITLVHRSRHFRARDEFMQKIRTLANVTILVCKQIEEIHGIDRTEGVTLIDLENGDRFRLPVDVVLIRIGVEAVDHLVPQEIGRDEQERIVADPDGQTNLPWLFAIGDLVNPPGRSSISLSVGQGMRTAKRISEMVQAKKS